jgi:hypothetical protein
MVPLQVHGHEPGKSSSFLGSSNNLQEKIAEYNKQEDKPFYCQKKPCQEALRKASAKRTAS